LLLRKHLNIWPGESIYVEIVKEDNGFECDIMNTFASAQDSISICVNHPDEPHDLFSVVMKRCDTLKLLKLNAIEMLSKSEVSPVQLEESEVNFRRGTSKGTMLKDENKTLHQLSFMDGSVVWLSRGRPCRPDEFVIEFVKYAPDEKPSFSPLISLPIAEATKISDVKSLLSKALIDSSSITVEPACLRLRDKKLSAAGSILRDSMTLRRSLMNLSDGRQIAVQFLSDPETITIDDIIVNVRGFRTSNLKFTPMVEMVVSKLASLKELRKQVEEKFGEKLLLQVPINAPMIAATNLSPEQDHVGEDSVDIVDRTDDINVKVDSVLTTSCEKDYFQLAKGLANGPPLKASSALTLKWDDPKWAGDDSVPISRPPVSLRDGSLLYIRSNIDANTATIDVPVKKKAPSKYAPSASSSSYHSGHSSCSARREPKLNISVTNSSNASGTNVDMNESAAQRLAKLMGVPLESAEFALEAAGQDEVLAREFL
jgi:hypothetical protein